MKIPTGFGTKLVFRLLLPGAILAAIMARPLHSVAVVCGLKIPVAASFIGEASLWGWLIMVLDAQIYMIFEGRRWWPRRIAARLRDLERRRLVKILKTMRRHEMNSRVLSNTRSGKSHARQIAGSRPENPVSPKDRMESRRLALEAAAKLNDFPLDSTTAMPTVVYPTRMGNLIAAYEQYPALKYRLDAVFFWPRLWVSIDKDLREEIDNQQALVDGTLYIVAALGFGAILFPIYAIVDARWPTILMYRQSPGMDVVAAGACAMVSYALYIVSLHGHSKFGDMFKAVFDQHQTKLDYSKIVEFAADASSNPSLVNSSFLEKNRVVYRFLRWQRIRRQNEQRNRRVRT